MDPADLNPFSGLLAVLSDEELIRCRRRLQKAGNHRLAEILSDEIKEREAIQKKITELL